MSSSRYIEFGKLIWVKKSPSAGTEYPAKERFLLWIIWRICILFFFPNPISIKVSGKVNFLEGCLSLPGYYWEIERPEYAKLDCFDLKGNKIFYEGDDLLGRVLQHELDHLNGRFFTDYLSPAKRKLVHNKLIEISKDGYPSTGVIL